MSAATLTYSFRQPSVKSRWTVPVYADLALNGNTILIGDEITVLSTGNRYECVGPQTYAPIAPEKNNPGIVGGFTGYYTDFRSGNGKALADTATSAVLSDSGIVVYGDGVDQTDSGLVVTYPAGGPVATMTASATSGKTIAISGGGGATEQWAPATYGPISVQAKVAINSALTARSFFIGFIDANSATTLTAPASGATVTITQNQQNMAGLYYDSGLTAASRIYCCNNNANANATLLTTATGVDSGINFSAAGTYMDLRVTVDATGQAFYYINGTLVSQIQLAVATATPLQPVLCITSLASATKAALVKEFSTFSLA